MCVRRTGREGPRPHHQLARAAAEGGTPGSAGTASKAGITSLTCTPREGGHSGITASVIYPAALTARGMDLHDRDPQRRTRPDGRAPGAAARRPRTDIAPIAVFLASDDSQF
jgi:NAD(P)-dependent dehydrogenase (short-subunit alcohol dehydrogenase family)